jgi:hypothetical protein
MNGKKAKELRRKVRLMVKMPTDRVEGVDINKIGDDGYYRTATGAIRLRPSSKAVGKELKRLYKGEVLKQRGTKR